MQFKYQLAILSLTTISIAQDLSSLPSCAQKGAASAIQASNCASTDIACICKSNSFISSLNSYAQANCSTDDYNQAITAGQTVCSAYGASISPSSTTTSDDDTPTPSSTTAADAVDEDDVDNASDASTSANGTVTTTTPITSSTTMAPDSMDMSNSTNGAVSLSTITRCSCQTEVVTLSASPTTTSTPSAVATYTGAANAKGLTGDGFELLAGLIGIVGLMI